MWLRGNPGTSRAALWTVKDCGASWALQPVCSHVVHRMSERDGVQLNRSVYQPRNSETAACSAKALRSATSWVLARSPLHPSLKDNSPGRPPCPWPWCPLQQPVTGGGGEQAGPVPLQEPTGKPVGCPVTRRPGGLLSWAAVPNSFPAPQRAWPHQTAAPHQTGRTHPAPATSGPMTSPEGAVILSSPQPYTLSSGAVPGPHPHPPTPGC